VKIKNPSTLAVVAMRKTSYVLENFASPDKYLKSCLESLKEAIDKNENPGVIRQLLGSINKIEMISESRGVKRSIKRIKDKISPDILISIQKTAQNQQGDNTQDIVGEIKESHEQLEQNQILLKNEVSNLADLQEKMNRNIAEKTNQLYRMNRENLEAQALLEYNNSIIERNKRIIDSMQHEAQLDSLKRMTQQLKINEQQAQLKWQDSQIILRKAQRNLFFAFGAIILIVALGLFMKWRGTSKFNKELQEKNAQIITEQEKSERLLLNILPVNVAKELKEKGAVAAQYFEEVSVLFADFEGFSHISKTLSPSELVETLDSLFKVFDDIVENHGIEKIKTIGDEYMCACGVPTKRKDSALVLIKAAIEIQKFLKVWNKTRNEAGLPEFKAGIGIHTGPLITGVVGKNKFAYDMWGDTVNIASRLESACESGRINISDSTAKFVKNDFDLESRGKIPVKNMSPMNMYYVTATS